MRVLVSGGNAASMRAVNYATDARHRGHARRPLRLHARRRARDPPRVGGARRTRSPLEVDEAPYRDIGEPLLRYLRELTADGGHDRARAHAGARRRAAGAALLHNQRALYLKRLLLFEPHVILASVPYQLLR